MNEFPSYFTTRTINALKKSCWKINTPDNLKTFLQERLDKYCYMPYFANIGDKGEAQLWQFAYDCGIVSKRMIKRKHFSEISDLQKHARGRSEREREMLKFALLLKANPDIIAFKIYLHPTPILSILTTHNTYKFDLRLLKEEQTSIAKTVHTCLKLFNF